MLFKCPECSGPLSSYANNCFHCGYPLNGPPEKPPSIKLITDYLDKRDGIIRNDPESSSLPLVVIGVVICAIGYWIGGGMGFGAGLALCGLGWVCNQPKS